MTHRWVLATVVLALSGAWPGRAAAAPAVDQKAIAEVAAKQRTEAKASWWGFDPTDSTSALQTAINSGAKRVIVENLGAPWVVNKIILASDQELVFERGVEVVAKRGEFKGTGDTLFTASRRQNVKLTGYGATLRMWRVDYDDPAQYKHGEWRHVISILSSQNVTITGLTLADSGGDGIYLGISQRGVSDTDIVIKDVDCVRNYRQGISVISAENLLIENCVLRDTAGTAPMAGIDFEPNLPDERLINCVMRNCRSENNQGDAYTFYLRPLSDESKPVSIRLENCSSKGSRRGLAFVTGAEGHSCVGQAEVVDCRFESSEHEGLVVGSKPAQGVRLKFERCQVINPAAKQPGAAPITISSSAGDVDNTGGIEFADVLVKDTLDRRPLAYLDLGGGLKLLDVGGRLTVEREGQRTNFTLDERQLAAWFPIQLIKDIAKFETKGVKYEPVVADAKPEQYGPGTARQRIHGEYLLYAPAGEQVAFTVTLAKVGKPSVPPTPVKLISPSGKVQELAKATVEGPNPYTFSAAETGAYRLVCDPGGATAAVSSTTHRVCQYSDSGRLHFLSTTGLFYFWVPPGVTEFAIKAAGDNPGERIKVTLSDAAGKLMATEDNIAEMKQFVMTRPAGAPGEVWTLKLDRPSQAIVEDYYIILQGFAPVLASSREALLKPVK